MIRAKNPEQDANSNIALTSPSDQSTGNTAWALKYVYDSNGNLTSKVDARNVTTTYGYDAINRNVAVSYSDGVTPGLERHYDGLTNGKGRLYYDFNYTNNPATGSAGYSRLVIGAYDAVGRVTSQTQVFLANDGVTWKDFQSTRSYDLAGHVLTQGYPSTRSVSYSYGASGRLSSASGNLGGTSYTYADTISYNAAGQMLKERFGTSTNLYHNLHYNNRLQLVDIRLGDSSTDEWNWSRGALISYYGTTAVANWDPFANSTDNNGNVLRQVNYVPLSGGGNVIPQLDDYTYDALNRVASMTEAQQNSSGTWTFGVTSQTYTYDRWGNRTSVTGQTAQSWDTTEASNTNRLKLTSGNTCTGTKNGLCYDAAGNLIFDNQLGSGGDRTYDAEGRIVTASGSGTNKYVYDADGKRVRRQVGSTQYWQVYGVGGELVAEYQWNGTTATLQKEYGSGGGAMIVAESATVVRWLVKDNLGTPRIIADQSGSLGTITRHDYYPFGEENLAGATIRTTGNGYQAEGVRQKFTGYERDTETNLDYAQARYYANLQARFTSVDPLHGSGSAADPQSWNRYAYVGNRPLTTVDPSGLLWARFKNEGFRWFSGDELDDNGNLKQQYVDAGWRAVTGAEGSIPYTYTIGNTLYILDPHGPNASAYGRSLDAWRGWSARSVSDAIIADGSEVAGAFIGGGLGSLVSRVIGEVLGSFSGGITTLGLSDSTGEAGGTILGGITNPVPGTLARIVPGEINPMTLGAPRAEDVFVTAASDIQGMTASQISNRLTIPLSESGTFRIFEFPTKSIANIASPINRTNPGFVGRGLTGGGARDFVIPNGPIPANATVRVVGN